VIYNQLDTWVIDSPTKDEWVQKKVTSHNWMKHRDLLWVLTTAGWMLAGDLIPDPIQTINDAIDADARSKGLMFPK
jgi:hypothetical protein